ncbi:MAG: fasciclin domain-containing protein [Acidobacteriota bacterium]|nr:fasciclin domain-containing protein [Acidobacteriota bacterium]
MKKLLMLATLTVFSLAQTAYAQCSSSSKQAAKKTSYTYGTKTYAYAGHHHKKKAKGPDIVETALASGQFKTLTTALGAAGLVKALQGKGPFTVFAPTDEAFAKLPEGTVETLLRPENKDRLIEILTYHVAKGRLTADKVTKASGANTLNGQRLAFDTSNGVAVGNAKVVNPDVMTSNGVIHIIDTVLLPTENNIVEVAANAGDFETLITAAKAAQLAGLLSNEGPFTVFAPTDEAFRKLPRKTLNNLLKPENRQKLADILTLHVVKGRVFAEDAIGAGSANAVSGGDLKFRVDDGRVTVNGANIVATDVQAENGVIHVIDTVLLPE